MYTNTRTHTYFKNFSKSFIHPLLFSTTTTPHINHHPTATTTTPQPASTTMQPPPVPTVTRPPPK